MFGGANGHHADKEPRILKPYHVSTPVRQRQNDKTKTSMTKLDQKCNEHVHSKISSRRASSSACRDVKAEAHRILSRLHTSAVRRQHHVIRQLKKKMMMMMKREKRVASRACQPTVSGISQRLRLRQPHREGAHGSNGHKKDAPSRGSGRAAISPEANETGIIADSEEGRRDGLD